MSLRHVFVIVHLLILSGQIGATPYIPESDAKVLERLPFKANDPMAHEMSQMRVELQRNPQNEELALRLARRYYRLVAEEGDPRYLGYAQAALSPWWDMAKPPIEVQVLRASLAQFRHDFTGALRDLGQVLERNPQHPQARVLRATIHTVQAQYEQARTDCRALRNMASKLIAIGCEALIDGLTGQAANAYRTLADALKAYPETSSENKLWVLTRLGEISERMGWMEKAEMHFKEALALGITDTFLLSAYADFLLEQNRAPEVVALLKDKTRSDTLLLRLVLAERLLNLPNAKEREDVLAARYSAAQLRGDTTHQQEEARFALHIQHDPQKALKLAEENWKVQLEPHDALIFLEAAYAAKDSAAIQSVTSWMERSHIEDRHLIKLVEQMKRVKK